VVAVKTFPGWREVGRVMRWARRQADITVELGGTDASDPWQTPTYHWKRGDTDVSVCLDFVPLPVFIHATGPDEVYQRAEVSGYDVATTLRVLAALGLIPVELAQPRQQCAICGEECRETSRWEHVKPLMVWREHGPHRAEVAE
jgi:hypothetical protein